MKCEKCGGRMEVTNTKIIAGAVVRYRKCPKCGHRIKTVEA